MIDYVLIARVEERVRRFLGVMDCGIDFRGARLKDQQLDFGGALFSPSRPRRTRA